MAEQGSGAPDFPAPRRSDDDRRPRGEGDAGRPRRRRFGGGGRRRVCRFCADKTLRIDYKWSQLLADFVSERGRIVPSRTTGTCAKHQRKLKIAIKRARNMALLPYSTSQ